jgi:endonuclease YncB( thermonuclease family)
VRISGIDAPELFDPRCREEKRLAGNARDRLSGLVAGRDVTIRREGRDRYGRTLATVYAGGTDVGAELVYEGLARWWEGRRQPWC